MHVGQTAAIGVEREFAAGAVLRSAMKAPASPARHKAQIFEQVDRQMREACPWRRTVGVVDHQVVDVTVRDAASAKALRPATRNAREEVKSSIWLTIGVSTLSSVPRR